jgi:hypothetical protein
MQIGFFTCGYPPPFTICKRVVDSLLKCFSRVVDTLLKGFACGTTCSLSSRRGLVQEDKRMALVYTHGLFIT